MRTSKVGILSLEELKNLAVSISKQMCVEFSFDILDDTIVIYLDDKYIDKVHQEYDDSGCDIFLKNTLDSIDKALSVTETAIFNKFHNFIEEQFDINFKKVFFVNNEVVFME